MEHKIIATEGGHWYTATGEPAYTVQDKKGNDRPTTLRDARKMGLLPSVTSVLQVYPKWGLIQWQKRQVLLAALTSPSQQDGETHDQYIERIMKDADEQALKAREKGTWIHGQIERYLLNQSVDIEAMPYIDGVISAMNEAIGQWWRSKCEAEKSFSSPLGYGGKVDLHSRILNFVADFKTKEFDESATKLAWDEQKIQIEAYRHGLEMPNARMFNVFISTTVPGLCRVVEHEDGDTWAWDVFKDCLKLWRTIKKY